MELFDDSISFDPSNNSTTMTGGDIRYVNKVRLGAKYLSIFVHVINTIQALLIEQSNIHDVATARDNDSADCGKCYIEALSAFFGIGTDLATQRRATMAAR